MKEKKIMNNAEKQQQNHIVTEWHCYHVYAAEMLQFETIIVKKDEGVEQSQTMASYSPRIVSLFVLKLKKKTGIYRS